MYTETQKRPKKVKNANTQKVEKPKIDPYLSPTPLPAKKLPKNRKKRP